MSTILTSIANQALGRLGQNYTLDSLQVTGDPPEGMIATKMPFAIRTVQGRAFWPELLTETTPDPDPEQASDDSYRFLIGTGWLKVQSVVDTTYDYSWPWRIEGQYVLSEASEVRITYTEYDEEPQHWSTEMRQCVVLLLASEFAFTLTQNAKLAAEARAAYDQRSGKLIARRLRGTVRKEAPTRWLDR